MGDNVKVDVGDHSQQDAAVLLLAAAEELDLPAGVVTIDTTGPNGSSFVAPEEVVEKAGLKPQQDEDEEVPDRLEGPTPDFFAKDEPAAQKTTAKKTAAKKTAPSKQE